MESDMRMPLLASLEPDASESLPWSERGPVIGIIGSGDFSHSLAIPLVASGFRVVVGSRDPHHVARGLFPDGVDVRSQKEAVDRAEGVVFAAVYPEHYCTLVGLSEQLTRKVLVWAELCGAVKCREAGKAFAQKQSGEGVQCHLCMGAAAPTLKPGCSSWLVTWVLAPWTGGLYASRDIEEAPLILYHSWKSPILVTLLLFLFFYGYNFLRHILLPYLDQGENHFYQLPLVTVNETLPAVALITLALVYLPGIEQRIKL
ncbi:hypothetical protein ABVT39_025379 [Epinephelus coioides]